MALEAGQVAQGRRNTASAFVFSGAAAPSRGIGMAPTPTPLLVPSQLGFSNCLINRSIGLSCLVGSVDGGGGSDGQGQVWGAIGAGTTGRTPDVALGTVYRVKQRFAGEGLDGALWDRPQAKWWSWGWRPPCPMRGSASVSKNSLKPWQKKEWCIPAVSAEFVANMEDVLDLYAEPYDPERPVVCFDETSTQLLAETRPPAATPAGTAAAAGLRVPEGGYPEPVLGL